MGGKRLGNTLMAAVLLAAGLGKTGDAAGLDATLTAPLRIALHLINRSGVKETVLDQAGKDTARIFFNMGVEALIQTGTDREDQAWASLPASCHLYVHIITMDTINRLGAHPRVTSLGMVLGSAEVDGISVMYVFNDKVDMWLTQKQGISKTRLLSYAVTHEIGHILLRRDGHSKSGIMQGSWDYRVISDVVSGILTFHEREAAQIRAAVGARCLHPENCTDPH